MERARMWFNLGTYAEDVRNLSASTAQIRETLMHRDMGKPGAVRALLAMLEDLDRGISRVVNSLPPAKLFEPYVSISVRVNPLVSLLGLMLDLEQQHHFMSPRWLPEESLSLIRMVEVLDPGRMDGRRTYQDGNIVISKERAMDDLAPFTLNLDETETQVLSRSLFEGPRLVEVIDSPELFTDNNITYFKALGDEVQRLRQSAELLAR